jgi:hypothetical protein
MMHRSSPTTEQLGHRIRGCSHVKMRGRGCSPEGAKTPGCSNTRTHASIERIHVCSGKIHACSERIPVLHVKTRVYLCVMILVFKLVMILVCRVRRNFVFEMTTAQHFHSTTTSKLLIIMAAIIVAMRTHTCCHGRIPTTRHCLKRALHQTMHRHQEQCIPVRQKIKVAMDVVRGRMDGTVVLSQEQRAWAVQATGVAMVESNGSQWNEEHQTMVVKALDSHLDIPPMELEVVLLESTAAAAAMAPMLAAALVAMRLLEDLFFQDLATALAALLVMPLELIHEVM